MREEVDRNKETYFLFAVPFPKFSQKQNRLSLGRGTESLKILVKRKIPM